MKVKPNIEAGITHVYHPDLKNFIDPEGQDVPETQYWHRMLMRRDVVLVVDNPPAEIVTKKFSPKEKAVQVNTQESK